MDDQVASVSLLEYMVEQERLTRRIKKIITAWAASAVIMAGILGAVILNG